MSFLLTVIEELFCVCVHFLSICNTSNTWIESSVTLVTVLTSLAKQTFTHACCNHIHKHIYHMWLYYLFIVPFFVFILFPPLLPMLACIEIARPPDYLSHAHTNTALSWQPPTESRHHSSQRQCNAKRLRWWRRPSLGHLSAINNFKDKAQVGFWFSSNDGLLILLIN